MLHKIVKKIRKKMRWHVAAYIININFNTSKIYTQEFYRRKDSIELFEK